MNYFAPCFKIETFGAVDGPGIRLVIFLQGCPYRCIYCHNPESWKVDNKNKLISADEIINKFENNKEFYKNGGITISGGEPLIHKAFCLELAKKCYAKKIHLAFDTSGCTFEKNNLN
jgi:pyruvate formate lyase activating enzyme